MRHSLLGLCVAVVLWWPWGAVVWAQAQFEGHGAASVGGQGGVVIPVTSLDDTGPGTLREALGTIGARTVVFRVAGMISLSTALQINEGQVTVAGQTAPEGGILLRALTDDALITVAADDVILQYLTLRFGSIGSPGSGQIAIAVTAGSHRVIVDHVSTSWTLDENLTVWRNIPTGEDPETYPTIEDITVQNSIFAEGLAAHSTGNLIGGENDPAVRGWEGVHRVSVHRNLYIHNSHRNPSVSAMETRVINNVIYSWASYAGASWRNAPSDWINNVYLPGGQSTNSHPVNLHFDDISSVGSIYASGNTHPVITDQQDLWYDDEVGSNPPASYFRASALSDAPTPVTVLSASDAYNWVAANSGNVRRLDCDGEWVSHIGPVDARLLADLQNRTGDGPPVHEDDVGGYQTRTIGSPCPDTDGDGIFDAYEAANPTATLEDFLAGPAEAQAAAATPVRLRSRP